MTRAGAKTIDIADAKRIKKIGKGAFGEVWLIEDPRQEEPVALKFLKIEHDQQENVELFKREFALLCELRHAHLARVFDFGYSPKLDQYYFTSELCRGQSLLLALKDKPTTYLEEILVQVLSALEYVHSQGVVHFDIKSENILVEDRDGRPFVKVLDFGVAAKLKALPQGIMGTPAYMAPEIIAQSKKVDHRADLYSLGMLILRALTLKLPFDPKDMNAAMNWHLRTKLSESFWEGCDVPRYLKSLVEKLLEKNPTDRFSSAAVALNYLNAATGHKYLDAEESLTIKIPTEGPLVGREDVLATIHEQYENAVFAAEPSALSSVCLVSGEQGIGKSRLIDEMRHDIELKEIRFFDAICDWQIPVWPQFETWLELGSFATDELNEEWQSKRRVDAVLETAQGKPLCILLDDFHKADRDMAFFIDKLREHTEELHKIGKRSNVFVFAATDETKEGTIELARLTQNAVSLYTKLVLGDMEGIDAAAQVLREYSGGLPLLMVEGLRYMVPHIKRGSPIEDLMPPPEIGGLYAEKIKSLEPEEEEFLLTTALIFRPSRNKELQTILNLSSDDLIKHVDALKRVGLIITVASPIGEEESYRVSSQALALDLIRGLTDERRTALHLRIAKGLENLENIPDEELAYHMGKGGEHDKGRALFTQAAKCLKETGQVGAAAQNFEKALKLAEEGTEEWGDLILETSRTLILSGTFESAEQYLKKIADKPSFEKKQLEASLAFKQRKFSQARTSYEESLNFLDPKEQLQRVLVQNSIGNIDLQERKFNDAEKRFRDTQDLEDTLREEELPSVNNNNLGVVLALQGKTDEAIDFYDRRLKRLKDDQVADKMSLLNAKGYALIQKCRFSESAKCLEEARQLAEKTGALHTLFPIMGNLITSLLKEARYAESLPLFKKMTAYQERLGTLRDVIYNLLRQGSTFLSLGVDEMAHDVFMKGRQLSEQISEGVLGTWFILMEGYREREFGDHEKAKKLFEQTRAEGEEHSDADLIAWGNFSLAEMFYDEGNESESQKYLEIVEVPTQDEEFKIRKELLEGKLKYPEENPAGVDDYFSELQNRCLSGGYKEVLWEVYKGWGIAQLQLGHEDQARKYFQQGIDVVEGIIRSLPEEYRDSYLKQHSRSQLYKSLDDLKQPEEPSVEGKTIWESLRHSGLTEGEVARALDLLLDINKRMVIERDPDRLLEEILDTAIELSGTEEGNLILRDENDNLESRIARNVKPSDLDQKSFSQSVARDVIKTGQAICCMNALDDQKLSGFESIVQRGLTTVICLPLKIHNRVIGVIYLGTKKQMILFQDYLLNVLQAFADLASLALYNAELFESEQRMLERLEADLSATKQELEEQAELYHELESLASIEPRKTLYSYDQIVGSSPNMEKILQTLDKVTNAQVPIFLKGETGTGKELVARALHFNSVRNKHSFVAINCSAFTETLLESELFGYKKGAFTGADHDRKGLLEKAHLGTLFLDEVADMSIGMQAKLLRIIQEQEVMQIGGREPIKIDVRFICASNKDLRQRVRDGSFREDLYFRLAGITIDLPPLRERRADIPILTKRLIDKICKANKIETTVKVSPEAMDKLLTYPWPGNIRELEQCLSSACLFAEDNVIRPENLILQGEIHEKPSEEGVAPAPKGGFFPFDPEKSLGEYESEIIQKTLDYFHGNKSETSRRLGVSRLTLYKKIKEPPVH